MRVVKIPNGIKREVGIEKFKDIQYTNISILWQTIRVTPQYLYFDRMLVIYCSLQRV